MALARLDRELPGHDHEEGICFQVSHHVAEFWNTVTNGAFLAFSLYGIYKAWRLNLGSL